MCASARSRHRSRHGDRVVYPHKYQNIGSVGTLNTVARTLLAVVLIVVLCGVGRAGEVADCPYCADWKPVGGHRFLSADVLVVRKDLVGFPGCNAATVKLLREQEHPSIKTGKDLPPALLAYFRLEAAPACSPAVSGASAGGLLELQYVPTGGRAGGEIEFRILKTHDIPTTARTASSAQWFAIRSERN